MTGPFFESYRGDRTPNPKAGRYPPYWHYLKSIRYSSDHASLSRCAISLGMEMKAGLALYDEFLLHGMCYLSA